MLNAKIESGTALQSGGGVGVHNATVVLQGSTLSNNTAGYDGGGVSVVDGHVDMSDCALVGNQAAGNGGAVHVQSRDQDDTEGTFTTVNQLHVSSSRFVGSVVGSAGKGGHVRLSHTNATFTKECVFNTTTSEDGGAFHVAATTLLLDAGTVIDHTHAQQHGGGVYATGGSVVKLQGVEMVGCRANVDGGALYAEENSKINVTHSALAHSSAGNNGGTFTIGSSAIGVLMHCEIDHSVAGMNGGVVHVTTVAETGIGALVRVVVLLYCCTVVLLYCCVDESRCVVHLYLSVSVVSHPRCSSFLIGCEIHWVLIGCEIHWVFNMIMLIHV